MKRKSLSGIALLASTIALIACALALAPVAPIAAQNVNPQNTNQPGYRIAGNGFFLSGQNGGIYGETTYNSGATSGVVFLNPGQVGTVNGGVNNVTNNAFLSPSPVAATSTATSGGFIAAGTYYVAFAIVTPTGGLTNITSTQETTQATTGAASTITATAPIAEAGASGYAVFVGGPTGSTLGETLQPVTTAVCAGASSVTVPGGNTIPICPFGTNAVLTSLTTTGMGIPAQNTASFPAAIPQTICNFIAQTANATVTTIQTMATCPMGAGIQNQLGKTLHITGHGVYTSSAQTGTMTITASDGGQAVIAITSAAITTGGQTAAQFSFDYYITTALTGTAGKVEAHGILYFQGASAANGTALTMYGDTNTGLNGTGWDMTATQSLLLRVTMTTSTTSVTLRDAQVVLMN